MRSTSRDTRLSPPALRPMRFEDVPELLRLIDRAVEHGCRAHYDQLQRRAVYTSYASYLFVEALGPLETVVAERDGALLGVAQVDPDCGRVRALFVDGDAQGSGVGAALVRHLEACAAGRGCTRLFGAMSLNAVPFYRAAGFRPCAGPETLVASGVRIPVVRMEKVLGDEA